VLPPRLLATIVKPKANALGVAGAGLHILHTMLVLLHIYVSSHSDLAWEAMQWGGWKLVYRHIACTQHD
jgi:hypothetical protein